MKNVLILLDGKVAVALLNRLIQQDMSQTKYDVVYTNDDILPKNHPKHFTFYKFDPSSYSKLEFIMKKENHSDVLVILSTKADTLAVINNILEIRPEIYSTVYNAWNIKFNNKHIKNYDSIGVLSNGLLEQLPNVPVLAQNVGLKKGEIMEINIPFGSLYAYRYIGSIEQKNWKIFAVYRNNMLVELKATVILKPNDTILIIGKPKVLLQVYSSISNLHGNFPMPFGKNIYVYIDMYIQKIDDILNIINNAKFLSKKLNDKKLIIKIVRPSTIDNINKIKNKIKDINNCDTEYDYRIDSLDEIIISDKKRFDIGVIVLNPILIHEPYITKQIKDLKIAIFKVGNESIANSKETKIILNNIQEYEQISPIIFDITSQLNHKVILIDADPIGDKNRTKLTDHFKNLSDIFNQNIHLVKNNKNPIRQLKKSKNTLQIMPLKHTIFQKNIFNFFSMDSDLLAFNLKNFNQILIPIIENKDKIIQNRRINDI